MPTSEHEAVEHGPEERGQVREGQEQEGGGGAAEEGDRQLHLHEAARETALHVARQVGAEAQGGEVDADDGGELRDRVAEHVARQRARHQLVDEPAGGDDEDGEVDEGRAHEPRG